MKIESSQISSRFQEVYTQPMKDVVKEEIKRSQGDSVTLSLKGIERLRESQEIDRINNRKTTSLSIDNIDGEIVFKFTDKETGELIKTVPSDEAISRYKRVADYLEKLGSDLIIP